MQIYSTRPTDSKTSVFAGPTYLPPTKPSTPKRSRTPPRTYLPVSYINHVYRSYSIPPWSARPRKSTTRPILTTTPKYAYYAPENRFYYPGEGLQLVKGGKPYYAVQPIPIPSTNMYF